MVAAFITPPPPNGDTGSYFFVTPHLAASGSGLANYAISYVAASLSIGPKQPDHQHTL
jgi:hypothetical protein